MKKYILVFMILNLLFILNGCTDSFNKKEDIDKQKENSSVENNIEKDSIDSVWIDNENIKITAKDAINDNGNISIKLYIENKFNDDIDIKLEKLELGGKKEVIECNDFISKNNSKEVDIKFKNKNELSNLIDKYEGTFLVKLINKDKEIRLDFLFKY